MHVPGRPLVLNDVDSEASIKRCGENVELHDAHDSGYCRCGEMTEADDLTTAGGGDLNSLSNRETATAMDLEGARCGQQVAHPFEPVSRDKGPWGNRQKVSSSAEHRPARAMSDRHVPSCRHDLALAETPIHS